MNATVAVLPGDGIGPEIMQEALKVLRVVEKKFGHVFTYHEALIGGVALDAQGVAFPEETKEICKKSDAILFGAVGGPKWENLPREQQPERAALLPIRKEFNLFANLRPSIIYKPLVSQSVLKQDILGDGFDIMIVRELTGGIYFGKPREIIETAPGKERAVDTMVYTTDEVERIGRIAFDIARKRRKKLCSVDKANVLDNSVLWRKVMTRLGDENSDVELSHLYVDNAAMQLVKYPQQFDTIVTENMFGDILTDLASVLPGSLGMIPSASLGATGTFGLYEPAGGSAPDIAGKGIANPIAQILSASLLLRYSLQLFEEADAIDAAVERVLEMGYRTKDILADSNVEGIKEVNTSQMGDAICEAIELS